MEIKNLDHPCKNTCSGWQQGFDKGYEEGWFSHRDYKFSSRHKYYPKFMPQTWKEWSMFWAFQTMVFMVLSIAFFFRSV